MRKPGIVILLVCFCIILCGYEMPGQNNEKTLKGKHGASVYVDSENKANGDIRYNILLPQKLLDKNFLQKYNWKNEDDIQEITKDWKNYDGTQNYKDRLVLKKSRTELLDVSFEIQSRQYCSDQIFEILVLNAGEFPKEFNDKFINIAEKIWGKPYKIVDKTYLSPNKENGFVNYDCEWFFQDSHIQYSFSGAEISNKWIPVGCYLVFTKNGKSKPLKDLVYLEFQGQKRDSGSDEIIPVQPFIFIVDFNSDAFLRRNLSQIAKFEYISEEVIQAKWNVEDVLNVFVIDRRMGTFQWKIWKKNNESISTDMWGKYIKMEGNEKLKF